VSGTGSADETGSAEGTASAEGTGPGDGAPIRVLTADDQRVVREGLALLLSLLPGVEVVGTAADGEEALALAAKLNPDVVLMDLRMPGIGGAEATRRLRAADPSVSVIVLTTYADDRSVVGALRAGAVGYLTKDAGAAEIRQALERVRDGQAVIDPAVQRHLVEAIAASGATAPPAGAAEVGAAEVGPVPREVPAGGVSAGGVSASAVSVGGVPAGAAPLPSGLTPREAEVLGLIAAGLSNTEIAGRLFVSEATVKSHINHMLPKIGARDRAQAVSYAYRHGLVRP
jgi:DNA-binding NarL/FixJ family response regulator